MISGLTRGTRREHLVRAALEAIAFQTNDVLTAMELDVELLRADGGAAANAFLLQFQADVAQLPVEVPVEREATALGAAALAGLGAGMWADTPELEAGWRRAARYEPELERGGGQAARRGLARRCSAHARVNRSLHGTAWLRSSARLAARADDAPRPRARRLVVR